MGRLFNKGDFNGIGSLYTVDATAFPPGASMVKGRAAIAAMWKNMAEQVSDPKVTTLDVKRLGPTVAREIGTFEFENERFDPAGSHRQICRAMGEGREKLEARD